MKPKLFRWHAFLFNWRTIVTQDALALFLAVLVFIGPLSAVPMRFSDRSLFMKSTVPGETTSYTISFQYMTPEAVGSVDMLFCTDPIPYMPCETPAGFDAAGAVLSNQSGETGFSIAQKTTNHIVLSRAPTVIAGDGSMSSYTFDNIKNPTNYNKAFAIRLKSHGTTNATGPQIDFGSVRGQASNAIVLETQVPPMLVFCAAQEVEEDCSSTNGNYFTDMGELTSESTLTAQSQVAAGTNATDGFVIMAIGAPPTAGTTEVQSLSSPTESKAGVNQFGINLVENTAPQVGLNPEGVWTNAVPSADYQQPDRYKYVSGDMIAYSTSVSLMKKFTVSYILNASPSLKAGVYTTTINFVASGRF